MRKKYCVLTEWRQPHSRRNRLESLWVKTGIYRINNPFVQTRKWAVHRNCKLLETTRQVYDNEKLTLYHVPFMSWDMWEHKHRKDV